MNHGRIGNPAVALTGTLEVVGDNRPIRSTTLNLDRSIGPPGADFTQVSTDTRKESHHDQEGKLGYGFVSADELEEIDIGDGDKPRPTFISRKLSDEVRKDLINLLKEYGDCFAWDYSEMPGLDRSIVGHHLPIKPGYRPYRQPPRKVDPKLYDTVK